MADVFNNVLLQIDKIADAMKLSEAEVKLLKTPKRIFRFKVPVEMDDGSEKEFEGFRVQYNDARGPTKGGIRYHPNVNLGEVQSLAQHGVESFQLNPTPMNVKTEGGNISLSLKVNAKGGAMTAYDVWFHNVAQPGFSLPPLF